MQNLPVYIRWAIRRDLPEILDIEQHSADCPWLEEEFLQCLRSRRHIGMVAENGDRVLAFMIFELCKSRLHILKMAVDPKYRRRGVASQLVEKLVGKLREYHRTRLTVSVSEMNLPGLLFLRAVGFRATSLEKGFFEDGRDTISLVLRKFPANGAELLEGATCEQIS